MRTLAIVAVLCALGLTVAYMAIAASTAPAHTVGVVNVERVFDEYEKAKKGTAELQQMTRDSEGQLKWMAGHGLLTDKEATELVDLRMKQKPTEAEKKNTPVVLQKTVVILGGTDLTDDVLKELNKK